MLEWIMLICKLDTAECSHWPHRYPTHELCQADANGTSNYPLPPPYYAACQPTETEEKTK